MDQNLSSELSRQNNEMLRFIVEHIKGSSRQESSGSGLAGFILYLCFMFLGLLMIITITQWAVDCYTLYKRSQEQHSPNLVPVHVQRPTPTPSVSPSPGPVLPTATPSASGSETEELQSATPVEAVPVPAPTSGLAAVRAEGASLW